MRTSHVKVLPYMPQWAQAFKALRDDLQAALGNTILSIEHVGSTSVPGMWAKPILDVDLVLQSRIILPEIIQRLQALGYTHEGDLGIAGREAFAYTCRPQFMAHHLYACAQDCAELHRHITFRDYLRNNADAREVYSQIKREAARLFPEDIDRYIAHKSTVIAQLYHDCGLS